MFTLSKFAYMALDPPQLSWYNTVIPNPIQIEFSLCCTLLLHGFREPADIDFVGRHAARTGHVDCMQAARRFGYQINERTLTEALKNGRPECVDFILRDGFRTESMSRTYSYAVANGHLECVRTLLRHGVPWDGLELPTAVADRRVDCVRFLLQNGCTRFDPTLAAMMAVARSDVACVAILREYGMPWSETIPMLAYTLGNNDLLRYVLDNGCPNPSRLGVRRSIRLMERRELERYNQSSPSPNIINDIIAIIYGVRRMG